MSNYNECLNLLLDEAEKTGYLTFDIIMDTTDSFDLPLTDVDRVSEAIQMRGIIVYETDPSENQIEDLEDYSRVDYDEIFREAVEIAEELSYIIEFIKELPPPQYKEVSILSAQIANGNDYARERLIFLHMRVVIKIALSMSKQHELDLVDAVSCGFAGLITAVDRYDNNGFSAFQSYASMWIQQSIQRECVPTWFKFYHPVHVKDKIISLIQELMSNFSKLEQDLHRQPTSWELLEEIMYTDKFHDLGYEKILEYIDLIRIQKHYIVDVDEIVTMMEEEESNILICSLIENEDTYFANAEIHLLRENINEVLATLTDREREILVLRNGLENGNPMTLEEVGQIFNVTRERIRQIEAKAIRKLRHPSRSKLLKEYY